MRTGFKVERPAEVFYEVQGVSILFLEIVKGKPGSLKI